MMPSARASATPMNRAPTAHRSPASSVPVSKAGVITSSVAQPSTHASATVSAP